MSDTNGAQMNVMYRDFLRNSNNIVGQLQDAVLANDFKTAHRLAHTTKSLSAIMQEKPLENISRKIEERVRLDNPPTPLQMQEFEREATRLLLGIKDYLESHPATDIVPDDAPFDKAAAMELFDNLHHGLSTKRGDVLDTIEQLQKIPQTIELITYIEDFEFAQALDALKRLRQRLEV